MRILVTGATGNIGRMVVDELLARGVPATDIRAFTNDPARAALPEGVELAHGWIGKVSTVPAALADVDVMYLAPHLPTVEKVTQLAAEAGVGRIVDLAGPKGLHWQPIEDAVEACGVPFTHLEPGEFMGNSDMYAGQIRAGDRVQDTYGDALSAPIAAEDVAAVAAAVLIGKDQEGVSYPLTGPAAISRREKVASIGRALGRDLTYVDLPPDEAIPVLATMVGPDFAPTYLGMLAGMAAAPPQVVTTVADLAGRPATTFQAWANANADRFR